jgi:glucose-6-phosphate 1-dehydrogenase
MRYALEMKDANPLREGRLMSRSPEPSSMVIFGGSGDLTRRKLMPALFRLSQRRLIPAGFTMIGVARTPMDSEKYRSLLRPWIEKQLDAGALDEENWNSFARGISYITADYRDPSMYPELCKILRDKDAERRTGGNRLYYLATAPDDYAEIIRNLGAHAMASEHADGLGWARIIIEKPFGRDLKSALELNAAVSSVFQENQIYRIDHYLGKETVQNILVFRFANGIFEPIWNRQYIDNVQIRAAENIGVGTRAGYYEKTGALRDMVQNHMMQLLALVAMEPPADFSPDSVRGEKAKVLRSIRPCSIADVDRNAVRAQYGPGFMGGKKAPGYREEPGVAPDSRTETFVALRFHIDNWRWADVPFFVRTGKNLAKHATEISVTFRRTPHFIFRQAPMDTIDSNVLVLRVQPDEGITLKFIAKLPGQAMEMRPVNMDFRYGATFGAHLADAYERLLLDCTIGDPTLFNRIDSVEASWALMQPFLDAWSADRSSPISQYESGSWGPPEADELLARDNRFWRLF